MKRKKQIKSQEIIYPTEQVEDYLEYIEFLDYREKYLMSKLQVIDRFYPECTQIADKQINRYDKMSFNNLAEKQWRSDQMKRSQLVVEHMAERKYDLMVAHKKVVKKKNKFLAKHAKNFEKSQVYHRRAMFAYELPLLPCPSASKRARK